MILRINILGVLCALVLINPLSMMGQDKQFTLHDLIPGGKTQSCASQLETVAVV